MADDNDAPSQKQVSAVPPYFLQFAEDFFADLRGGWEHFRLHASEEIADEWEASLLRETRKISENPLGYGLAWEETRFKKSVRRMLHQRTKNAAVYRVLFYLKEPVTLADGTQATPVFVFAALHASARPLSARKARDLERRN